MPHSIPLVFAIATLVISVFASEADGMTPPPPDETNDGWIFWTGGSVIRYSAQFDETGQRVPINFGPPTNPKYRSEHLYRTQLGADYGRSVDGGFRYGARIDLAFLHGANFRIDEWSKLNLLGLTGLAAYGPLEVQLKLHFDLHGQGLVIPAIEDLRFISLGAGASHRVGRLTMRSSLGLTGRGRYELPFLGEPNEPRLQRLGNITHYRVAATYRFGAIEAGLAVLAHTQRQVVFTGADQRSRTRSLLSIASSISLAPRAWPITIEMRLSGSDIDTEYGIPLAGRNNVVPSAGLTGRLAYSF